MYAEAMPEFPMKDMESILCCVVKQRNLNNYKLVLSIIINVCSYYVRIKYIYSVYTSYKPKLKY